MGGSNRTEHLPTPKESTNPKELGLALLPGRARVQGAAGWYDEVGFPGMHQPELGVPRLKYLNYTFCKGGNCKN